MSTKKKPTQNQLDARADRNANAVLGRVLATETPGSLKFRESITRNTADVMSRMCEMFMDELGPQGSHMGLCSALADIVEIGTIEYNRMSPNKGSALIFWSVVSDLAERLSHDFTPADQFSFASVAYRGPDTVNRIAECLTAMLPPKMADDVGIGMSSKCFEENARLKEILNIVLYKNGEGGVECSWKEGNDLCELAPELATLINDELATLIKDDDDGTQD